MNVLRASSLGKTLDVLDVAGFAGETIPLRERRQAARWILARCEEPGGYVEGMPAPTDQDLAHGIRLFTGEWMRSHAGVRHILGEEGCRALLLLGRELPGVEDALRRVNRTMTARLGEAEGFYCCGTCSVALWRHLSAGGLTRPRRRLAGGIEMLRQHRTGEGTWRRFPYWYTLLALLEAGTPAAREELRYATARCERILERKPPQEKYARRRRAVAERALNA